LFFGCYGTFNSLITQNSVDLHANNKMQRRYLPNLQQTSVLSDVLSPVTVRLTAAAIRTIEHKGGIDAFLRNTRDSKLSPEYGRLKRRVAAAASRKSG
jgi:large subunit ribosomal protein L28